MLHHIKKHKHWLLVSVLALGGLAWDIHVLAGSASSTIAVSATVQANCSIPAGATLNFATYDPTSAAALAATGSFSLTCTKGTTVSTIGLNNGVNSNGGTQRQMKGSTSNDLLQYNVFQPVGANLATSTSGTCPGTTAWDNGTNKLTFTTSTGKYPSTQTASLSVCGQIPAAQVNSSADSYSDTITITVNF